ncbi:hypothetical protein AURDEDRAFT_170893 [Auricularia subglabra TFB-10046 SS5]|nr:hypothetical protein AURDEDRAFT_170893 [Auricularia subglabra TFB-10046 SS5]
MPHVERGILRWGTALAKCLVPVHSPTICPSCLLIFGGMLKPGNHAVSVLQTGCPALWDAMMLFVCAEWTSERQQSVSELLQRTASRCRTCSEPQRQSERGVLDAESAFDKLFRGLCWCLSTALRGRIQHGKGYISKSGRWPTSTEQLFPYGPERTLTTLIAQVAARPHSDIIVLALLSLNRRLSLSVMMQAANRAHIIAFVISRMAAFISALNADLAKIRQPVLPAVRTALALRHFTSYEISALIVSAACFGIDCEADEADRASFCHGYEQQLFGAFHETALLLHGQAHYHWVSNVAGQLWLWVRMVSLL